MPAPDAALPKGVRIDVLRGGVRLTVGDESVVLLPDEALALLRALAGAAAGEAGPPSE